MFFDPQSLRLSEERSIGDDGDSENAVRSVAPKYMGGVVVDSKLL
jgi:hypothetical protein